MRAALFVMSVIVAFGLIDVDAFRSTENAPDLFHLSLPYWSAVAAPLLPLSALGLVAVGMAVPAMAALGIAFLAGLAGAFFSFGYMALSGAGASLALIHGIALTGAISSAILILSPRTQRAGAMLLGVVALLSTWSLVSGMVAAVSARSLADSDPYCIALHGDGSAIATLSDLRGFSFFTTRSGHKSTSNWYFHGVLIVARADGAEVWNWSPRRLAFHRLETPDRMIADPSNECDPKADFLNHLPLV